MFLSKIWWFLVLIAAFTLAGLGLLAFRPGQRELRKAQEAQLARSQATLELILKDNAVRWLSIATQGAVDAPLREALDNASRGGDLTNLHKSAKARLGVFAEQMKAGNDWLLMAVDGTGRVVARAGLDDDRFRDGVLGYPAIADALRGYRALDTWDLGGRLYRVAVAPVIQPASGRYVGALAIGVPVDSDFARKLQQAADMDVAFFVRGEKVASSIDLPALVDLPADYAASGSVVAAEGHTGVLELGGSGTGIGDTPFLALAAPLVGEAAGHDAFFAVVEKARSAPGLVQVLKTEVTRADLQGFPWLSLGLGLVLSLGVGLFLLQLEGTGPLGKLVIEVQSLRRDGSVKVADDRYRGKFGSLARAINAALDRLASGDRPAGVRGKDIGEILGDLPPPGAPPLPPPASSFNDPLPPAFSGGPPFGPPGGRMPTPPPLPPAGPRPQAFASLDDLPPPPPPDMGVSIGGLPAFSGPPPVMAPGAPRFEMGSQPSTRAAAPRVGGKSGAANLPDSALDDLVLPQPITGNGGAGAPPVARSAEEQESDYPHVFDEYLATKRRCGEPVEGFTFERFVVKLRQNRDQLLQKHACRDIKFEVYVKDGKAALRATPVK